MRSHCEEGAVFGVRGVDNQLGCLQQRVRYEIKMNNLHPT
jgi:hypothetical protein